VKAEERSQIPKNRKGNKKEIDPRNRREEGCKLTFNLVTGRPPPSRLVLVLGAAHEAQRLWKSVALRLLPPARFFYTTPHHTGPPFPYCYAQRPFRIRRRKLRCDDAGDRARMPELFAANGNGDFLDPEGAVTFARVGRKSSDDLNLLNESPLKI
jgi:hypothetical protein